MKLVMEPSQWSSAKASSKYVNDPEGVKNHRQLNDSIRHLNVPGAEEGPDGEFISFFKETFKLF